MVEIQTYIEDLLVSITAITSAVDMLPLKEAIFVLLEATAIYNINMQALGYYEGVLTSDKGYSIGTQALQGYKGTLTNSKRYDVKITARAEHANI